MRKPKAKVSIAWSSSFAYAIGLIVSDGNLSPNGRHISFTSKDEELVGHYLRALNITSTHIGRKSRSKDEEKRYYCVQFSDVLFYRFLVSIGLMPNKSRSLETLHIPDEHFSHFLRGLFDGDGSCFSYWDKRWKKSFMYYTSFASASPSFLLWLQEKIAALYDIHGSIQRSRTGSVEQLVYAKKATVSLFAIMYEDANNLYLTRKHLKLLRAFSIMPQHSKNARVEKLVNSPA